MYTLHHRISGELGRGSDGPPPQPPEAAGCADPKPSQTGACQASMQNHWEFKLPRVACSIVLSFLDVMYFEIDTHTHK